MPEWVRTLLTFAGGIVVALGGIRGVVAVLEFRRRDPREQQKAITESFVASINSLQGIKNKTEEDEKEIGRLRREHAEQQKAWRAQQELPKTIHVEKPTLRGQESAELRALLEAAGKRKPPTAEEFFQRGNAHFDLGEYGPAINAYDRAIGLIPKHAAAHRSRGASLGRLKHHKQALAAYNQAIKFEPGSSIGYSGRGAALGPKQASWRALFAVVSGGKSEAAGSPDGLFAVC